MTRRCISRASSDATARYVAALGDVAARVRADGDPATAATLWMRLGALLEEDATRDLARAAAVYADAESVADGAQRT
jgi:hypothetical protein